MEVLKGTDDELLKAVLSGKADMPLFLADYIDGEVGENKGGAGSGFHAPDHAGRPGEVGGSRRAVGNNDGFNKSINKEPYEEPRQGSIRFRHAQQLNTYAKEVGVQLGDANKYLYAVDEITSDAYVLIRSEWQKRANGNSFDKEKTDISDNCDKFIELSPKWGDSPLYRNVAIQDLKGFMEKHKEGSIVDQGGVSSWTSNERMDWHGNVRFRLKNGSMMAVNVTFISPHQHENEVLMHSRAKMKVDKIITRERLDGDTQYIVDVTEVHNNEVKGGPGSGFHSGPNRHGRPGKVGGSSNSHTEVDKPVNESPKKIEPPPKFNDSVEGEEWLANNFGDTKFYNIRSLNVEDVQDIATSLYEFEKYFPGAIKTLSMLRVSSKKSDGVEDMQSSVYATTEMWYKDTHLSSKPLTDKSLRELESMRKDCAPQGVKCRITLNTAWFGKREKFISAIKLSMDEGYHPHMENKIKQVVDHELGHVLYRHLAFNSGSDALNALYNFEKDTLEVDPVSIYAHKSPSENWAESYSIIAGVPQSKWDDYTIIQFEEILDNYEDMVVPLETKGGPGSGFTSEAGHAGRPGLVGGSRNAFGYNYHPSSNLPIATLEKTEINKEVVNKAKEIYGVTDNPEEAGYLMADGSLLDFTGANVPREYMDRNGYVSGRGSRVLEHATVSSVYGDKFDSWSNVSRFMNDTSAMRVGFTENTAVITIMLSQPITRGQSSVLSKIIREKSYVYLDIYKSPDDMISGKYLNMPLTIASLEFPTMADIKREIAKANNLSGAKSIDVYLEWKLRNINIKGGPGSGFFGHAGRPGLVGGSMHPNELVNASRHPEIADKENLPGVAAIEETIKNKRTKKKYKIEYDSDYVKIDSIMIQQFGRKLTNEEIFNLVGAMEGVKIHVVPGYKNIHLAGDIHKSDGKGGTCYSKLEIDLGRLMDKDRQLYLDIAVNRNMPEGSGTKAFYSMVKQAQKLGVDKIELFAVRGEGWNGYYTWARLGGNGLVPRKVYDKLPPKFMPKDGGPLDMHDLMKTKGGREWWKENGDSVHLIFDLEPKSTSMKVLDKYMKEKGYATKSANLSDDFIPIEELDEELLDRIWANIDNDDMEEKGGPGSGFTTEAGHAGRPGEVGGSRHIGAGVSIDENSDIGKINTKLTANDLLEHDAKEGRTLFAGGEDRGRIKDAVCMELKDKLRDDPDFKKYILDDLDNDTLIDYLDPDIQEELEFNLNRWELYPPREIYAWIKQEHPDAYEEIIDNRTYSKINEFIKTWAMHSANNNADALVMQEVVSQVFDLKNTYDLDVRNRIDKEINPDEYQRLNDMLDNPVEMAAKKAFIKAEYELTQKYLADNNIKSMVLYRGYCNRGSNDFDVPSKGQYKKSTESVALQPASSFSASVNVGLNFAIFSTNNPGLYKNTQHLVYGEVPANRILSTCRTGRGCSEESEVIVIGGTDDWNVISCPEFTNEVINSLYGTTDATKRTEYGLMHNLAT